MLFPDTSKSRAVILYIHHGKKAILAEVPPPKTYLVEPARGDSQYARLLYMLRRGQIKDAELQLEQDIPLTSKRRKKLLSLAIARGYTNIVEILL